MKMFRMFVACAVLVAVPVSAAEGVPPLADVKARNNYAVGMNIGIGLAAQFREQGVVLDAESLARGLRDAVGGGPTLLNQDEMRAILAALQAEIKARQEGSLKAQGERNKVQGETFLAANAKNPGVITLPSGLQYKVLKEGSGRKPTADDSVECHYRGTFVDGTEFDSSHKRGKPATFKVKGVIAGWTEALQLMTVGSTWQLFIPSNLGYGPLGSGKSVGPNAALVFEVELISIK